MIATNRAHLLALACCLIAFLLSVWTLDARSLWGDEAFSVWASKQSALSLIAGLDAQPPLYHLLLGAARASWGESVFAIRFVSVCCGVLLVAVAARLGWLMGGSRVSVVAALILATSPILIYYEQEARMYALAVLLAGGAMLCVAMLKKQDERPKTQDSSFIPSIGSGQAFRLSSFVLYALLSLGALFAHFYTVGVLLVNSIALGIDALRSRNTRRMVTWLTAHLAISLVFGTWFFGLQSRYVARSAAGRSRIFPLWEDVITNFGAGINGLIFGMRADGGLTGAALILFALALLGLIGYWRCGQRGDALLILGWIVVSLGLVSATAARSGIVSDFSPRYYLFALLPLALAAGGWSLVSSNWLLRRQQLPITNYQLLSLVFVALIPAVIGNVQLFDANWAKSRYDTLVSAIRERAQPTDGVILVNSDQFPLMDYYGPMELQTWAVSNSDVSSSDAVNTKLDEFMSDKPRVWLVNYGWAMALQPRSLIEQALNARGARTYSQGFQDASLALYDLRQLAGEGAPVQPQDVGFGEQIKLVGVRERGKEYSPGDAITLDLFWQASEKPRTDYTVFMHLRRISDGGQIAANDSQPVNGSSPTSSWSPGKIITDTRAVQIPTDAQPGDYNIIIGWYQSPSFERLKLDDRDMTEYVVSQITISQP